MSAGIIDNRQTIDLTGLDSDDDDDEVVFIGQSAPTRPRSPPAGPPAMMLPRRYDAGLAQLDWAARRDEPQHQRQPEEPILIESDSEDDDELEEQAVDRLIPPLVHLAPPPPRRQPIAEPLRLFSPPAQFRPPPRDPQLYHHHHRQANAHPPPPPAPHPRPPTPPIRRIGLGGGFMAFRNLAGPSTNHQFPHWIRNVLLHEVHPEPPPRPPSVQVDIPVFGGMVWDAGRNEAIRGPVEYQPWFIAGDERLEQPKPGYTPTMTHKKEKPSPGFTFDFEPSATAEDAPIVIDVDAGHGSSSSSSSAAAATVATPSLICARCNETLRMGSRTMWGLRCGHVVCGDCGEYLSKPIEGKGKGKASEEDIPPPKSKGKGKGRARAVKQEEDADADPSCAPPSRRTRSRAAPPKAPPNPPAPTKRKRGGKKQDTKPVMLAEYEYSCPVEGCLRPHFSQQWKQPVRNAKERDDGLVQMEVVWKPKPDSGAVPIFT